MTNKSKLKAEMTTERASNILLRGVGMLTGLITTLPTHTVRDDIIKNYFGALNPEQKEKSEYHQDFVDFGEMEVALHELREKEPHNLTDEEKNILLIGEELEKVRSSISFFLSPVSLYVKDESGEVVKTDIRVALERDIAQDRIDDATLVLDEVNGYKSGLSN
jgi:hypothetical protein